MTRLTLKKIIERCDLSPIPMSLAKNDGDEFPLIHINHPFAVLTGYDQAMAIGKSCRFLQGKNTEKSIPPLIRKRLMNSESVCSILTNYRRTGEEFHNFLIIESLVSADKQRLFVGFQYEVSDYVQATDLTSHIDKVFSAERSLGKSGEVGQSHQILALRQRTDAALLALKMLASK